MSPKSRALATGLGITIFCALVGQWTMFYIMVMLVSIFSAAYMHIVSK